MCQQLIATFKCGHKAEAIKICGRLGQQHLCAVLDSTLQHVNGYCRGCQKMIVFQDLTDQRRIDLALAVVPKTMPISYVVFGKRQDNTKPPEYLLWLSPLQAQGTDALSALIASINTKNEQAKRETECQRNRRIISWFEGQETRDKKVAKKETKSLPSLSPSQECESDKTATKLPSESPVVITTPPKSAAERSPKFSRPPHRRRGFSLHKTAKSSQPNKQPAYLDQQSSSLEGSISTSAFQQAWDNLRDCNEPQQPLFSTTAAATSSRHVRFKSEVQVQRFRKDRETYTLGKHEPLERYRTKT